MQITGTTTIDGAGTVTLSGNSATRLFDVTTTGTLNLTRITLEKGHSATTPGGAIANHGTLNLSNVTMRLNINSATVDGGAIFTDGRNTKIDNCSFDNNVGASGGAIAMANGAVSAGIQIASSQFTNNSAQGPASGFGGAIFAGGGCLVVRDSAFTSNLAIEGGAILALDGVVLTISGSPTTAPTPTAMQFNNNGARDDGGAIFGEGANVSITNAAFSTNHVPKDVVGVGFGGAVVIDGGTLGLSSTLFFKNEGRFGGALHVRSNDASGASATIDKVNFLANTSGSMGGAVYLRGADANVTITGSAFESNATADGGGGLVRNDTRLRIENSSFTRNTATRGGAMIISTLPGGSINPYVRIQSVTVSGNVATTGGGVYNSAAGVEMYSMTIAGNTGGGVLTDANGNSRFRDTVLQNAGAANCSLNTGSYADDGANMATDTTCHLVNANSLQDPSVNPGLGALTKDSNGLTSFMKAGARSVLLDRGVSCPTLDQIGAARVGGCDIGAVESGYNPFGGIVVVGGGVFAP